MNSNCTVTSCKDDSQAACFWPQTCLLQNQGCPSNKLSRSIFYGGVQLMPTCDDLLSNLPWCDDTVEQQGLTIMLVVLTNAKFGDVVARKLCRTNDQIQVTTCFHPGCWSVAVPGAAAMSCGRVLYRKQSAVSLLALSMLTLNPLDCSGSVLSRACVTHCGSDRSRSAVR